MPTLANKDVRKVIRRQTLNRAKRMHEYYILLLIPVVLLVVFKYLPMYGIIIAFKDFSIGRGIHDSPWNNFDHFKRLFQDPFFYRITRNTVIISVYRIIFGFPAPIILALLLNEIRSVAYKKTVQTLSYLPHFVSWVVLAGIFVEILSAQRGPIAHLFTLVGLEPVSWLTYKPTFRGVLVVTGIWQSVGWGSIVYLASLSSIDPGLYETASIDGANRWQQAIRITVPSLLPVITILFLLNVSQILNAGFEQIFNLFNPSVYEVADVIDTYIYRSGFVERRWAYNTGVGLFKNVVGLILLIGANAVIKRYSEYGIW